MKILGINGSPRGENSQTKRLMDTALNGAQENGAELLKAYREKSGGHRKAARILLEKISSKDCSDDRGRQKGIRIGPEEYGR